RRLGGRLPRRVAGLRAGAETAPGLLYLSGGAGCRPLAVSSRRSAAAAYRAAEIPCGAGCRLVRRLRSLLEATSSILVGGCRRRGGRLSRRVAGLGGVAGRGYRLRRGLAG